jgi:release factor glutamine methyltransferase
VSPACLIPRPETELLVDLAVRSIPSGSRFADLCTGSGCIAISTLKNTKGTHAVALDLSPAAISIATENANRNGVRDRIEFVTRDVLCGLEGRFFAILSNPPYVSESAYASLDAELYSEPKMAFVGGKDGGDFYRKMIPLYKENLLEGGFLAFEIGYDQGELLRALGEENGMSVKIIKDYSSLDRIALLRNR